ncbi:MAG: Glycine--tRNA ligase [Parcubacteria group bacterium Gr01-1014_70]|nr:MAG: Glycine--tRNA ligase [Parcubacteria group bacterium Gr01-1014_70]
MVDLEKIVSLCKRRGFVFQGSEIYGGFAGTYDYGPYGVELKRNIEEIWLNAMNNHSNIARLDSSIFTARTVWEASGHATGFSDPLVICNECHTKHRADHLLDLIGVSADEKMTEKQINEVFDANRDKLKCPSCGKKNFSSVRSKNLMATSNLGNFEEGDQDLYLRAETAQGIYINYKNILDSGFYQVPFGIAQIGKVFRNEISPRQFLFRMREFEQMEMQYFVKPEDALRVYEEWKTERMAYYDKLGVKKEKMRWKQHENLVFYAKDAWDIQYKFPFGWNELEGLHYRSDYDLTQHQKFSGVDMSVYNEETKQKYIPHIIEVSVGVDRTILMVLCDAYDEDDMNGEKRVVLRFSPRMAPIKAAVFPLLQNKPKLVEKAREIFWTLKKSHVFSGAILFDDNGNIGKRYRRQDEIGTPFCVTVDFDSLEKGDATVRDRDTGKQERISISELSEFLKSRLI